MLEKEMAATNKKEVLSRSNLFVKVELEHQPSESPDKLGEEICRTIRQMYGVRNAEVSSTSRQE